jgi:hypothetical protein
MAFMAVLESDLRALSAEARRRHPAVKEGAEHAILKVTDPIYIHEHVLTYIHMRVCIYIYIFVYVCLDV